MDVGLEHCAVLRRADLDAPELVLGRHLALDEFADLAVDVAQFARHFARQFLVDLQHLQLVLGNLAARLCDRGDQLSALALKPRRLALERGQAVDLDQILLEQFAHAGQFALDQRDLLGLGGLLRGEAADLFLQLGDALAQLRFLPEPGGAAQIEQLALARHGGEGIGIAVPVEQLAGKFDRLGAVALGFQPRLARAQLDQALADDREIGAGDGLVETHHHVAGPDAVAVAHAYLADDAAGRMLHLLDVGIDDDRSGRDQRAGQFGGGGPAADAADQHQHDGDAGDQVALDRILRLDGRFAHDDDAPASGTTFSGRSIGVRCSTLLRTSSLGPNTC